MRALQEKLYRHQQLNSELDINSKQLFVLNKEFASLSDEASEMERFETFESIMAPFLRMQLLDNEAEENRTTTIELEQQLRCLSNKTEEMRKHYTHSRENIKITEAQHQDLCRIVEECSQHDGACAVLEDYIKRLEEILTMEEDRKEGLESNIGMLNNTVLELEKKLEALNGKRHPLETHEVMLGHSELILNMLHRLDELNESLKQKNQQYTKNAEEQMRAKEDLAHVIEQQNGIDQQIQTLQDESEIHRNNIRGIQSYEVQERVMKLKSRQIMLAAAQSLWRRISTGYANIEEKTQLINALRLEIEHDTKTEQSL